MNRVVSLIGATAFCITLLASCGGGRGGGAPAPITPSTVSSVDPQNASTGVPVYQTISVVFSKPMTTAEITENTFQVRDALGGLVTGTVTAGSDKAMFKAAAPFSSSTLYTAMVTTGVTDASGNHAPSNYSWSFTTADPPAAPSSLTAAITSFPSGSFFVIGTVPVGLKWADNADNETGFVVEELITTASGTSYQQIGTTNANQTNYLDTTGGCRTNYYRVKAVNQTGGQSAPSAPASVTLAEYSITLQLPQSSLATSYTLTWNQANAWMVVGTPAYTIQEAHDTTFAGIVATYTTMFTGASLYSQVISKPVGTSGTFCYRARLGTSCWTNPACIVVNTTDVSAPSVPSGLTAAGVSKTMIRLSWNASSDNYGVADYRIYRDGVFYANSYGWTDFTDMGLSDGAQYCYAVSAIDASGNESAQSSQVCVETLDATKPTAPANLQITWEGVIHTFADLSWDTSTDNVGVTGYTVYRCVKGLDPCNDFGYLQTVTTPYLSGIFEGPLWYCYVVTAVDAAGNESGYSNAVCD